MRGAADVESIDEVPAVRPGLRRPLSLAMEQCEPCRLRPTVELLRRKREERDEIEAAVDWATNRVWTEWFHQQWRAQQAHMRAGRSSKACLGCPAMWR